MKLIISMTSYPKRIKTAHIAIKSILSQKVDKSLWHFCLVLSTEEFPRKELDLPYELVKIFRHNPQAEIIWTDKNTRSHKKLMPALERYPDNPILVCDDDDIRKDGWLLMFIDDHKKHPNDIIAGTVKYRLDYDFNNIDVDGFFIPPLRDNSVNVTPNLLLTSERPSNGLGGTLYPAHTFQDWRFYDSKQMLRCCPTSDEMWQYCFNILEGKTLRQSSKILNFENCHIIGTQLNALWQENTKEKYTKIYLTLFKEFPEFREKMRQKTILYEIMHHPQAKEFNINLLSLSSPETFQEKINWLKIHEVSSLKCMCSDKVLLHEFSKRKLNFDICVPIIHVYDSVKLIDFDKLPKKFMIKCNHGNGFSISVNDIDSIDKSYIIKTLENFMKIDYSKKTYGETQYKNINRKILAEHMLSDLSQPNGLLTYQFWCFNGEPKLFDIAEGYDLGNVLFYSLDFKEMNLYGLERPKRHKFPTMLNQMREYAKILSHDFKFVRIDFFEVDKKVYLRKMTFSPRGGMFKFKSREEDLLLGSWIDLNRQS